MEHSQRIFLLHSLLNSIVSVRVENAERVPKTGGTLIVCNHSDLIDPLVQGLYTGRNLSYLAKAELIDGNPLRRFQRFVDRARRMGVPALVLGILTETLEVLSQLLRDARILPIVRGYRTGSAAGSWQYYDEVIANVVRMLREGEAVAMYPEGGRSYDGKLRAFRGLAARIAIQAGVPVIPTALVGAHGFSDLNRWVSNHRKTNRSIIYRIGEAIDPREYAEPAPPVSDPADSHKNAPGWRSIQNKDAIKALTRRMHDEVAELLYARPRRPRKRRPGAPKNRPAKTADQAASGTEQAAQETPDLFAPESAHPAAKAKTSSASEKSGKSAGTSRKKGTRKSSASSAKNKKARK